MTHVIKNPPTSAGDPGSIPGWEDPLEKEMATQARILAWEVPWREETGRLQSEGSPRVRHSWAHRHTCILFSPRLPQSTLSRIYMTFEGGRWLILFGEVTMLWIMVLKWCFGFLYCFPLMDFSSQSRATSILYLEAQPLLLPSGSIQLYSSSSGPITKDYYSLG